jgi:large subunit ribosomal protein L6
MSRVGKKPIPIPEKASVEYTDRLFTATGDKGSLSCPIHPHIDLDIADGMISVKTRDDSKKSSALQGMVRSLVSNVVTGVSAGFERKLEINGIGYRVALNGNSLELNIGYSHPVVYNLPDGIQANVDKNTLITLSGIDKELLGHAAAAIRRFRPPEPYKGKGIKYAEERIHRKAGKTGAK